MDARSYWRVVREKQAEIGSEKDHWLISIANHDKGTLPGSVVLADSLTAARCLVDQTHRVATDVEVRAYEKRQSEHGAKLAEQEMKRALQNIRIVNP